MNNLLVMLILSNDPPPNQLIHYPANHQPSQPITNPPKAIDPAHPPDGHAQKTRSAPMLGGRELEGAELSGLAGVDEELDGLGNVALEQVLQHLIVLVLEE